MRGESTFDSLEEGVVGRSRTLEGVVARTFEMLDLSVDPFKPPDDFVLVTL